MRRSPMKPGTKSMKRTGFAPKVRPVAGMLRTANLDRSAIVPLKAPKISGATKPRRRPRPKQTKIRASARDQECTLRFPGVCSFRTDTTVLCHSNQLADGKGMGLKAPDERAAYGCSACHDVLDGRRPRPQDMTYDHMLDLFKAGVRRTHEILIRKGLLTARNNSTENGTVPFFPGVSEEDCPDEH